MPDTELIHKLFEGEDQFSYLVEEMDHEDSMHELLTSVEEVGRGVREEEGIDVTDIDDISLGWMKIAWEGHHTAARLEGDSFADMMEEA